MKIRKWSLDTGRALPIEDLAPHGDLIWADRAEAESLGRASKFIPIVDSTVTDKIHQNIDQKDNSLRPAALKVANTFGENNCYRFGERGCR